MHLEILDIISRTVMLMLTVSSYAMALRMMLPLFVEPEGSKIYAFTCILSEPIVAPIRALLSMLGLDGALPIDLSLPTAYILIFVIQSLLPPI